MGSNDNNNKARSTTRTTTSSPRWCPDCGRAETGGGGTDGKLLDTAAGNPEQTLRQQHQHGPPPAVVLVGSLVAPDAAVERAASTAAAVDDVDVVEAPSRQEGRVGAGGIATTTTAAIPTAANHSSTTCRRCRLAPGAAAVVGRQRPYLIEVRHVLRFLYHNDPVRYNRARAILNDCLTRMRRLEPGYAPLTVRRIHGRLRAVIRDCDWRRGRCQQQQGSCQQQQSCCQSPQPQQLLRNQSQQVAAASSSSASRGSSSSSNNSCSSISLARVLNQLQRQEFLQRRGRHQMHDDFFVVAPPRLGSTSTTTTTGPARFVLQDEFVAACWNGDMGKVRRLLLLPLASSFSDTANAPYCADNRNSTQGLDINLPNQHGKRGLLAAVRKGHHEVARVLLEQPGVDLTVRDADDPRNVLEIAVDEDCASVVRLLVLLQSRTIHAMIPNVLHSACRQGRLDSLVYLANSSVAPLDWKCYNDEGLTPLHVAVMARQPLVVAFLLLLQEHPIDLNAPTRDTGDTALHVACRQGCIATTQLLLRHTRIDRSVVNHANQTALEEQPAWPSWDIVQGWTNVEVKHQFQRGLVRYGWAREEVSRLSNVRGGGPWHAICKKPKGLDVLVYLAVTETLGETVATKKANWNHSNYRSFTTLHTAANCGSTPLVAFLLCLSTRGKVDVNARNRQGDTPLHLACQRNDVELIRLLLSHSQIDWSRRNKTGVLAWERLPAAGHNNNDNVAKLRDYATRVHVARLIQTLETISHQNNKDNNLAKGSVHTTNASTAAHFGVTGVSTPHVVADHEPAADVTGKALGVLADWLRIQTLSSAKTKPIPPQRRHKRKRGL